MNENEQKKPVAQLVMMEYPEYIRLSESRRKVYWNPHDNIPKKYRQPPYDFINVKVKNGVEQRLVNMQTRDYVIRNMRTAGTPRLQKINGQSIWVGMNEYIRVKLRDQLHNYFEPYVLTLNKQVIHPPKEHYLHLEYIFYFPFSSREPNGWQDYFNHAIPYMKTFEDTMVKSGMLINDSPTILRGAYSRYVSIPTADDRRIVVRFYHCRNNESI